MDKVSKILEKQKQFFFSGQTLSLEFRLQQLNKLKHSILANIDTLLEAFKTDFNKCEYDVFTTEVGLVLEEIKFMKKHLKTFMKGKKAKGGITNFPSKAKIVPQPLGQVLIMSPWNYPFQLAINPLVGAVASGNTTVVKPSAYCPKVSECIKKILSVFDEEYIAVILGGREQNQSLLEQKFDLIFFTGSKEVGKVVQEKASKYLCPVVLELGGKSPCIVDSDCNLKTSVRRIVWGKFLNAGQTCVAPDYIFVHESIYEEFLNLAKEQVKVFYYENEKLRPDFPFIINEKHTKRLSELVDNEKIICGGKIENRLIEPTILRDITIDDKIMQEEIFGPLMPVLSFNDISQVIKFINSKDRPLALYYFGKQNIDNVLSTTYSGGACINETVMHVATNTIPFGGVGESGMGSYHGLQSLYTFSHMKSILIKKPKFEMKIKYPPITKFKKRLSYKFLGLK